MSIASRGRALVARAADNFWFALVPLVAAACIVGSVAVISQRSLNKGDLKQFARDQAAKVDSQARQRTIDQCDLRNPSRAYLRIRANEFVTSSNKKPSYTTLISSQVFPILNCEATVDSEGQPISLALAVEAKYIKLFRHKQVAVVKNGQIVGSKGFVQYFGRKSLLVEP